LATKQKSSFNEGLENSSVRKRNSCLANFMLYFLYMFILYLLQDPIKTLGFLLGLTVAITVHEFMHAYVADKLGDPTAKSYGRVSLNPLVHLDPTGTLFILLAGFGWGKPVPINPANFYNPRLGEALSALAGPATNLLFAVILSFIYHLLPHSAATEILNIIIYLNIILCVFNLLPIPPLDGSKLLWAIFPKIDILAFERYGITLLFTLILLSYISGYSFIGAIVIPTATFIANLLGISAL
jgi:Zn-dependent protease